MLGRLGYASVDELMTAAVPEAIRWSGSLDLPEPTTEAAALAELRAMAARNTPRVSMLGLGFSGTVTPAVLRRNVLENPAWYTAYTPYQPEISQGRLEALLTFQTVIADLTGLPTAGASLLDEPTAAAEAMALARRASRAASPVYAVDADTLPQTVAVLTTRARPLGIRIQIVDLDTQPLPGEYFGLHLQYPGASGAVRDHAALIAAAHAQGALATVAADLLACTLLREPGAIGADIAVGSAQRFGLPLGFGGPHAGYLAVRAGLERQLPGRLVGVSRDAAGDPAYRLALQTREQHIRRERATSNICTAQVLLAVIAGLYAVHHGPDGLREIAWRVATHAARLAAALRTAGIPVVAEAYFDTVTVRVPGRAAAILAAAEAAGVNLRRVDPDHVAVACDETTTEAHLRTVLTAFDVPAGLLPDNADNAGDAGDADDRWIPAPVPAVPADLARTTGYLNHPVFSAYRSETAMLRYLRRLADRDYALDRGMIPLGSCTMKLNAAAELEPISWPGFADPHPYAPAGQVTGYTTMIAQLEQWLAELTGYDAVSLQPNAGSQGELAGLLAVRAYHHSRGDRQRDVCVSRPAPTAPMPPAPRWPGCGSWWSAVTPTATSTRSTWTGH